MSENNAAATAPTTANICAALAAAQAEFKLVRLDKVNPHFGNKYASLASILAATRPALNAHGISIVQRVVSAADHVNCTTVLLHASGEKIIGDDVTIPLPDPKTIKNIAQTMGSALTYARRYSLSATLCVAAEEDDDGNGVDAPAPAPAETTCPPALKARAEEAAKHGISAYESFFREIEKGERLALSQSGLHAAFKALAMRNTK